MTRLRAPGTTHWGYAARSQCTMDGPHPNSKDSLRSQQGLTQVVAGIARTMSLKSSTVIYSPHEWAGAIGGTLVLIGVERRIVSVFLGDGRDGDGDDRSRNAFLFPDRDFFPQRVGPQDLVTYLW